MNALLGETPATLSGWLKKRRGELEIGQSEAARRAEVGRASWIAWENGLRHPFDYNHASIERAMQWEPGSVEAILGGKEPADLPQEVAPVRVIAPPFGEALDTATDDEVLAAYDHLVKTKGLDAARQFLVVVLKRRRALGIPERAHDGGAGEMNGTA